MWFKNLNKSYYIFVYVIIAVCPRILSRFNARDTPLKYKYSYKFLKNNHKPNTSNDNGTLFCFPVHGLNMSGAIIVGIIEEIGKLAIIIYFIRKINPEFILNCLLIGATIGAGFAAFESTGYAFSFGSMYGENAMMSVIFT